MTAFTGNPHTVRLARTMTRSQRNPVATEGAALNGAVCAGSKTEEKKEKGSSQTDVSVYATSPGSYEFPTLRSKKAGCGVVKGWNGSRHREHTHTARVPPTRWRAKEEFNFQTD